MERSLRLSLVSYCLMMVFLTMEELSFSTSRIMLLTSSCLNDSKVNICPNFILPADSFLLRVSIWCLNQFF